MPTYRTLRFFSQRHLLHQCRLRFSWLRKRNMVLVHPPLDKVAELDVSV